MKLVFYNNCLNHHQVNVADEFYKILGDDYTYVATVPSSISGLKGGMDYNSRPYCIMAGDSEDAYNKALDLSRNADVCVFGAESLPFAVVRAKYNPKALSFELGERWMKKGWKNILSPNLRKWWIAYQRYFRSANFYKLNASAFAASDHYKLCSYKGRCYKWGYFTSVPEETKVGSLEVCEPVRLMWCARFIDWKHPELAIQLAERLKQRDYSFQLDLYGDGELRSGLEVRVERLGLIDCVQFHGNVPNSEIHKAMRQHDMFLLTSDRGEGWGAVANEAMTEGCLLIGSDEIGAIPFLVKSGNNGLVFKSKDLSSLCEKVEWAINNKEKVIQMRIEAMKTMTKIWSPKSAAVNLLKLIDDLQHGRECTVKEGPASVAEII